MTDEHIEITLNRVVYLLFALIGFQFSGYPNTILHESGHSIMVTVFDSASQTIMAFNWWKVLMMPWYLLRSAPSSIYNLIIAPILGWSLITPAEIGVVAHVAILEADLTTSELIVTYSAGLIFQMIIFAIFAYVGLKSISPVVSGFCAGGLFGSALHIWGAYTDYRWVYGMAFGWLEEVVKNGETIIQPTIQANFMSAYTLLAVFIILLFLAYSVSVEIGERARGHPVMTLGWLDRYIQIVE